MIKNKKTGFTLIEALVAISILMIAIASPMTLAQKSLSTASLSKDQMIAAFLAQDAIEAVKNIRDQVAIRGDDTDWLDSGLSSFLHHCICNPDSESCSFDTEWPESIKFCRIDTTSPSWNSNTITLGDRNFAKIRVSYSNDVSNIKNFLKYDYNSLTTCLNYNISGQCGDDSKFSRYINIIKDPANTNPNEAVVNVRVFWDSALGTQKVDIQNFIYNYSENLLTP